MHTFKFLLASCCFFSIAPFSSAAPPKTTSAKTNWYPEKVVDRMTDEARCVVKNRKDKDAVFFPVGRLDIDFRQKGFVEATRFRIDSNPVSEYREAEKSMQRIAQVVDNFDEIPKGKRLLVDVRTAGGSTHQLEYDLEGLGSAVEAAKALCS